MLNDVFLSKMEQHMLKVGYKEFNRQDKNSFITYLAEKNDLAFTEVTGEYILNHHKKLKISMFSERCEAEIIQGFTASNGHHYRTNRDDQTNFIGKMKELELKPDMQEIHFKTSDVGYVSHTRQEFIQVFLEGIQHKEKNLTKYNTLKHQILNAVDEAEVLSINWD